MSAVEATPGPFSGSITPSRPGAGYRKSVVFRSLDVSSTVFVALQAFINAAEKRQVTCAGLPDMVEINRQLIADALVALEDLEAGKMERVNGR